MCITTIVIMHNLAKRKNKRKILINIEYIINIDNNTDICLINVNNNINISSQIRSFIGEV